ncbi:MAG: hypothetical protein WA081_04030 [Desulfosalsimonadaceae bacterium]
MARHLNYNPGRDSIEYLEAITCGENRLSILEQLVLSLKAEIGRPNHQHHLLIGPRGAGKTHLLRLLTGARIPDDPALAAAYLPVVMPEETPLRSPGDLFLKFVDKLAEILREPPAGLTRNDAEAARGVCLTALTTAKGLRDPLERLDVMAAALASAAKAMGRIILPVAENMDQTFYLGAQRSRKNPLDEQWALRRHLQDSAHLLLIAAAPSIFGAVGDPGKPFFDFFRTHELQSLSSDEVLEIIRLRLKHEASNPGPDGMRNERVQCLLDHFVKETPQLRGILAITGGLPRFTHLTYEVIIETDVNQVLDTLNGFLDNLTPYFQHRLDPRVIPQPEIDLLHVLALARGPQQPTELADELYGVPANEVSELLGRLQERGLVKRAGRPGGQAVTWDLIEPLYRVWTQFRDNPEGQEEYRLLAEFVALFFSLDEVEKEIEQIGCKLSSLPDDHCEQKILSSRKRLLSYVKEYKVSPSQKASFENEAVSAELSVLFMPSVQTKVQVLPPVAGDHILATDLFNAFNDAREKGEKEQSQKLLEELRVLNRTNPEDGPVRKQLARGLFNAFNDAGKEGDKEQSQSLLGELRNLSLANPEDGSVLERLAKGLFNAHYDARKEGDREQSQSLLEELRILSRANSEDGPVRESLAMGLFNAHYDAQKEGDREQSQRLLEELQILSRSNPEDAAVREQLADGLFDALNDARKEGDKEQVQSIIEELLKVTADNGGELVEKIVQKGAMMYAKAMLTRMKAGETAEAKEGMRWLEARMPTRLQKLLRPAILAMEVLEKGEEQALAREPEEVRRVVRTLLENLD